MAKDRIMHHAYRLALSYGATLFLTGCSITATLALDGWPAIFVPLTVAVLTVGIVAIAYMKLPRATAVSLISVGVAGGLLAVMFGLTLGDEMTRAHIPPSFEANP